MGSFYIVTGESRWSKNKLQVLQFTQTAGVGGRKTHILPEQAIMVRSPPVAGWSRIRKTVVHRALCYVMSHLTTILFLNLTYQVGALIHKICYKQSAELFLRYHTNFFLCGYVGSVANFLMEVDQGLKLLDRSLRMILTGLETTCQDISAAV